MALKDRLKTKTPTEGTEKLKDIYTSLDEKQKVEFDVSIKMLTKKILNVKDNANLGAIVKEFAKFLSSLSDCETSLALKGDFDIGKKALIACLLANITGDANTQPTVEEESEEPKLIKKKKSLKQRLKRPSLTDDE